MQDGLNIPICRLTFSAMSPYKIPTTTTQATQQSTQQFMSQEEYAHYLYQHTARQMAAFTGSSTSTPMLDHVSSDQIPRAETGNEKNLNGE
jgi:hypothetical protein